jgi:hypothetical protein
MFSFQENMINNQNIIIRKNDPGTRVLAPVEATVQNVCWDNLKVDSPNQSKKINTM